MVPEQNAVPIPDGVDLATAAVLTCAGMTAMHATKLSGLRLGDTAVVDGIGGVGILVVQAAAHAGARVIAVGGLRGQAGARGATTEPTRRASSSTRAEGYDDGRRRGPRAHGRPRHRRVLRAGGDDADDDRGHPLPREGRPVRLDRLHGPVDRHPPDRVHPARDLVDLDRRRDAAGPAGRDGPVRGGRDDASRSPAGTRWRASTTRSARCASARCSAARCSTSPDRSLEGGNA